MTTINPANAVGGLIEGQTLTENKQHGVLAGDRDSSGYPLSITAVANNSSSKPLSSGSATIQGTYGTLVLNADGSYSYAAKSGISFPSDGIVQDTFAYTVMDSHGNSTQATLTLTVTQPGLTYVAGRPGDLLVAGNNADVLDASLGCQIVFAGNGNDSVLGGAFDAITVGSGNDTIIAGSDDLIIAGNGRDTVTAGTEDLITLGDGNDSVSAGADDVILARDGNNSILGAADDAITLGNGNNNVTGGSNDAIALGNGKNVIAVGSNDSVAVGQGTDTFVFDQIAASGVGRVTIAGFSSARDILQFNANLVANFAAVKALAKQAGANTVITFDKSDSITLLGVTLSSLQASNFVFSGAGRQSP
jgi:VCBS repeat-containing protein